MQELVDNRVYPQVPEFVRCLVSDSRVHDIKVKRASTLPVRDSLGSQRRDCTHLVVVSLDLPGKIAKVSAIIEVYHHVRGPHNERSLCTRSPVLVYPL